MLLAMRRQTELAIEEANVAVLVTDGKTGLRPEDKEISRKLRKAGKRIIVCVNKTDVKDAALGVHEFTQLGVEHTVPVSAEHGRGIDELVAAIVATLPPAEEAPVEEQAVKAHVAIVGRPNAGKSSLINKLLGEERHLATPIAGTTRDSIDSYVEHEGERYCFVDTAGRAFEEHPDACRG